MFFSCEKIIIKVKSKQEIGDSEILAVYFESFHITVEYSTILRAILSIHLDGW